MTVFAWTDREGETHGIEPETDWVNYGDVNPRAHGGRFIKFDGSAWELIETRPPDTLPDGLTTDEHLVQYGYVYPEDIWIDGDPDEGPTDWLERTIHEVHGYDSYEQAMLEAPVEYWVADWLSYYGGGRDEFIPDSNWNTWLENRGIDP